MADGVKIHEVVPRLHIFPRRRIKLQQNLFLFFHQRKKPLGLGTKVVRPTRCGSPAHELPRVIVMPESNRMTQLVGDDVATDVGESERRGLKATDGDETFVGLLERHCEGNKRAVRQRDNQISLDLRET